MLAKSEGKLFETDIESSCLEQKIFYFRVRDVNPMALKPKFKLPQNRYDCLIYHKGYLFPIEMKSTKAKSISLQESVIKEHQIKNLTEASTYEHVIPGFLMNFREPINQTFFIHIKDFITYKHIAENGLEHTYHSKVNKSSIPLDICKEIGTELTGVKKQVRYRYYINKLIDDLIEKFGE